MKKHHLCLPVIALLLASPTAFANTPLCLSAASDSDNDGWGWENNQSCIVSNDTTTTTALPVGQTFNQSGRSVCSSSAVDPDGDGWGWENNRSCVVASSDNTPTVAENENTVVSSGPTICSSADADPDGDGWGWENDSSCRVAAGNTPTPPPVSTPSPVPAPVPATRPACSVPSFDDNNDGFGFENNQVCVVETPVEVRIMALGDSITHGSSREFAASYRRSLDSLMTTNNCQGEMVGSQTTNFGHSTYVAPHEGYNGHTADEILNGHVDVAGNNEGISVTANRYQPHVVLLHIGSNDTRRGDDINQTVAEIDQIISVILAADSAPVVFLANVIPWFESASVGRDVARLGDQIEAYVTQLNNPRIRLVDVRTGFEESMILNDGVHPNPAGELLIAERFFEAYETAGFCR